MPCARAGGARDAYHNSLPPRGDSRLFGRGALEDTHPDGRFESDDMSILSQEGCRWSLHELAISDSCEMICMHDASSVGT